MNNYFVIIIILASLVWIIYEIYQYFINSDRKMDAIPPEIHILINTTGSTMISYYRKRSKSGFFKPPGNRKILLTHGGGDGFKIKNGKTTIGNNGTAIITIEGARQCRSYFSAKIQSNKLFRMYGPVKVPVFVYTDSSSIPSGISITSPIDIIEDPVPETE